ncbi:hypothetical protein [Rhodococcus zopfii]|uniref:hypothetical protein n=1 Tax=Rhodococcus zopfii TaxID=43772 RepID=UPI003529AE1D
MLSERALLKNILLATKDGDWGKSDPADGLVRYHVIRGTDFQSVAEGDSSTVPVRYLSETTAARRTLESNDILIETAGGSRDRPTGRTMLVTESVLSGFDGPATCASFARFLRVDPEIADPRFVYWFLQFLYRSGQIEQYQVQHTGVARFQYTQFAANQEVPILPMRDQGAIADVLGALDDKIAANCRLAKTIDDLIYATYLSGIRGNPGREVVVEDVVERVAIPRRMSPDEVASSGDFPVFDQGASVLLGYASGGGYIGADTISPVLYFGDHTCRLGFCIRNFAVGPNTIPFRPVGVPALALYMALRGVQRSEEYKRHWKSLLSKRIFLPSDSWSEDFCSKWMPGILQKESLHKEILTLSSVRDVLLMGIMSGRIRVRDVES